jgi:hypothetical protein
MFRGIVSAPNTGSRVTTRIILIVTLGLAAAIALLPVPGEEGIAEAPPTNPVRSPVVRQKPAFVHSSWGAELPIIAEPAPPLGLARFRSTHLSPEVLTKDAWLLKNSGNGTAKEFREALARHFPTYELSLGQCGREVLQCVREIEKASHQGFSLDANKLGRIDAGIPIAFYIHRVLNQSTPQEERNRFCRVVDSLMRMHGDFPGEQVPANYLFLIFANTWIEWRQVEGKGAKAASAMWRSSELFRHLAYGEPPVSELLSDLVLANNRKSPFNPAPPASDAEK